MGCYHMIKALVKKAGISQNICGLCVKACYGKQDRGPSAVNSHRRSSSRLQTGLSTHQRTPAHCAPGGRKQKCWLLPRIQQNIGLKKESF